tara:strand:- start:878 stop:1039 length:162 start_codon:yes stop_codon:yes gene_type:complete
MQITIAEKTVPYSVESLKSRFDYEGFLIVTWGLEPINGFYLIPISLVDFYDVL